MRRLLVIASLLLLVTPPASAAPPIESSVPVAATRYTGLTVAGIEFQAPAGVDTGELTYLIDQQAGAPYDPQAVERSLQLLFRLEQFDEVQARVRATAEGLVLTFVLRPSPLIRGIRLRGVRKAPVAALRGALSRGPRDPYIRGDEVRLEQEAEVWYRRQGYLRAKVDGKVGRAAGGGRVITLFVDEGPGFTIEAISFPPTALSGLEPRQLTRWLGPAFQVGRRYTEARLQKAAERLLERYHRAGFVEARLFAPLGRRGRQRVPVKVRSSYEDGTVHVTFPVDSGRFVRAEFHFEGRAPALWRLAPRAQMQARLETLIGLRGAQRVSETYVEEAARRLQRSLQDQGYYHATVSARIEDVPHVSELGRPAWRRPKVDSTHVLRFTLEAGPKVRLARDQIQIDGNEAATDAQIIQVLTEASPDVLGHRNPLFDVLLGFAVHERFYTDRAMKAAVAVLRDYYRSLGHLSAEISFEGGVAPAPDGGPGSAAQLSIHIVEGAQTIVERLDVQGPLGSEFTERWEQRVQGQPLDPGDLDELAAEARGILGEQGYLDARIDTQRELNEDGTFARLSLIATPGVRVRFGKAIVQGNRITSVGLIRRDLRMDGADTFRPSVLSGAQGRLLRTGLFEGVVLRPAQSTGRVRDVEVLVNERKRFSFVLGAGVSWPDQGPRISGEARLRNLDGRGFTVFSRGRINVDWRNMLAGDPSLILPEYRASLGVEFPYIPVAQLRGGLTGVLNELLDEPTFQVMRSSVTLTLSTRGSGQVSGSAHIELQGRAATRVDPVARLAGPFDEPTARPFRDLSGLLLVGGTLIVDKRDDRFNPEEGLYLDLSADTTPGAALSASPAFGRASGRVQGLLKLGDRGFGVLVEAAGGLLWSYNGLLPPVEWRFRLGGTSTVRGFALDAIGPVGKRPGSLDSIGLISGGERSIPVGGNAFYRWTIELRFPIPFLSGWRLVAFQDAGNAFLYGEVPAGVDGARSQGPQWSVGFGVRRLTPIGPLRLDLAFRPEQFARLPDALPGDVVQLHFAVGAL